jgi:hypothetical protein
MEHSIGLRPGVTHPAQYHAAAKPLWTVVRQELDERYTPGTDPTEEWVVYYVTRSGVQSSVRVPRDLYSSEYVRALITPEAELLEEIAHLRSEHKP